MQNPNLQTTENRAEDNLTTATRFNTLKLNIAVLAGEIGIAASFIASETYTVPERAGVSVVMSGIAYLGIKKCLERSGTNV